MTPVRPARAYALCATFALEALLVFGCGSNAEEASPKASSDPLPRHHGVPPTVSASAGVPSIDHEAIAIARKISPVKSDERVVLFPAYASRSADDSSWECELHGWIHEPEVGDYLRDKAVRKLKSALDLGADQERSETFDARVRPFGFDNERGKAISVSIAGKVFTLPHSEDDGHFVGRIEISESVARPLALQGTLEVRALLRPSDDRAVSSALHLVEREGLTIVSDVDDTVKVSEVRDKRALLRRTFLQAFEAVPNMGPKYTTWLGAEPSGTGHLHFVSSSPWQLFEPLHTLMGASGFAPATYDLKRIRPREIPTTAEELLADPRTTKPPAIRSVMERFPKRKFVLVGDSGERDPEVYGVIGRERPDQIVRIYIRDVTGEKRDDARYRSAFEGIPAEQWILFDDASKLPDTP